MAITKTQIKKWNDEFKSLSKPEQRVLVAKDVIKQIKAGKYYPFSGQYIGLTAPIPSSCDIQSNFDKIKCDCCALGGTILSMVKYKDNLIIKDLEGHQEKGSEFSKMLSSLFSPKQQALIEAAFEDGDYPHAFRALGIRLSNEEFYKCQNFYDKYSSDYDRLIAIMENLIKNKGTFKP